MQPVLMLFIVLTVQQVTAPTIKNRLLEYQMGRCREPKLNIDLNFTIVFECSDFLL